MARINLALLPESKDPLNNHNFNQFLVIDCIYNTLINLGENGELESEIAKEWKFQNSHNQLELTLKRDATFQDGSKITADDVIFSLSRHLWPNSKSVTKNYLEQIKGADKVQEGDNVVGITKLSEEKVLFSFINPMPYFTFILTMPSFSIISKHNFLKGDIIGSGRMKIINWSSSSIKLEAIKNYKGSKPTVDNIIFSNFKTYDEISSLIKSESIDLVIGGLTLEEQEKLSNKMYNVSTIKTLGIRHCFFNSNSQTLSDNKLRELLKGIFQISLKETYNSNWGKPIYNYFPLGIMPTDYYIKSTEALSYYKVKRNTRIRFILTANAYSNVYLKRLVDNARKNKIDLVIEEVSIPEYFKKLETRDYDIISGAYYGNFPDPVGFIAPLITGTKLNYLNYDFNKEYKDILLTNSLLDQDIRLKKISSIFKEFEEKNYFIPLMQIELPYLCHKGIEIPDSKFRYESELWKLLWTNKK